MSSQVQTPLVESLLQKAHSALHELDAAVLRLRQRGLTEDELPNRMQRQAFALLGNYERERILRERMSPARWDSLHARGLVDAPQATDSSTPLLRLLSALPESLDHLATTEEKMIAEGALEVPPEGLLTVRGRTRGAHWGEPVCLQITAAPSVQALYLHGDAIMDMVPMLVRRPLATSTGAIPGTQSRISGELTVLADRGSIYLTILADASDATSTRYRQAIAFDIATRIEDLQ